MNLGGKIIFAAMGLFFLQSEIALGTASLQASPEGDIQELKVFQLIVDPASQQPVVLLTDLNQERALLIWIGPFEANAIQSELQGIKHHRPLTHDLLEMVIQKIGGRVERIIITHSKDGIYFAKLIMQKNNVPLEFDARPSDSIVLALKFKAPIFVSRQLFQEMAIPLKETKGVEEIYGLSIQDLTPELAQSFSFSSTKGALIAEVQTGSKAEKDGLKGGDILVELASEAIADSDSFKKALTKSKGPLRAKIFRQGQFLFLTLNP
ncbi:MAG: bifunctional nuclease domain-containing protein [Thermodesulfobacteriota bacterium]